MRNLIRKVAKGRSERLELEKMTERNVAWLIFKSIKESKFF